MSRLVSLTLVFFLSACARASIPPTPTRAPLPTYTPTSVHTPTPASVPQPTETRVPTPIATPAQITYSKNPRALLIEADIVSGFALVPRDAHVPKYRLYADGFVVYAGARASSTSGLDAEVRVGYLADAPVQASLNYLAQIGFFAMDAHYHTKPAPNNSPTWQISVYLEKAKSVSVYAAGFPGTPPNFMEAFARVTQTLPADAETYEPTEGFLQATPAGSSNDLGAATRVGDWTVASVKLADASDGITVSGNNYRAIAALVSQQYPHALFRENSRVYRVRFAPLVPRAPVLSEWLGALQAAPREFDGRAFDITGYFRGANIFGEAQGSAPKARADWVIADAAGAMWVSGIAPNGLDLQSARDAWNVVHVRAAVVYVRSGTSYLEARRVETVTPKISITPTPLSGADAAIALVKAQFPQVAQIKAAPRGTIGASTDITVIAPRVDAWYLVFWEGWGDCPSGCINQRYFYFVVQGGQVTKAGEYTRVYNSTTNAYDTTGAPMWGVPK